MITLRFGIVNTFASVGVRPWLSRIIISGWCTSNVLSIDTSLLLIIASYNSSLVSLQLSNGSSAKMVPIPTSIASWDARNICPSLRELSFVIHWDWPVKVAILPSRDIALFMVTNGLCVWINVKKYSFNWIHSSTHTSVVTFIPASVRIWMPLPATSGFGSVLPITTRAIPDSTTRFAHGGVFP